MRENINLLEFKNFIREIAKDWQDYIPYDFIEGINLSAEQIKVVDLANEQLMINGIAGSGKSITLLYKMIKTMIREKEPQRILYLSYNQSLVSDAIKRAKRSNQFNEYDAIHRVDFYTFHAMVHELFKKLGQNIPKVQMKYDRMEEVNDDAIRRITAAMLPYTTESSEEYKGLQPRERLYKTHTSKFIRDEIFWMKGNGFITEESYMEAARAGRGAIPRLEKAQRRTIFEIYKKYQHALRSNKYGNSMDLEDYALKLLEVAGRIPDQYKYDYIYIDEVQDLQPMQIKALTSITKKQIIISGDNKQRIYKTSNHTYEALGLGRLRRRNLIDNFRSTKQIMELANSIAFKDTEHDKETHINYVREGVPPKIKYFKEQQAELQYLVERIKKVQSENPHATIAVIVRNDDYVNKTQESNIEKYLKMNFSVIDINQYGLKFSYEKKEKQLVVTDPYSVKGLEFDYVFITHFDCQHYPLKSKIEEIDKFIEDKSSESQNYLRDKEEIINNEKRILYVAMTRAKQELELLYWGPYEQMVCQFVTPKEIN